MAGLITSRAHGWANSAVYSAAATASGIAKKTAMTVTLSVLTKSGRTEYFGTSDTGCHVYWGRAPGFAGWRQKESAEAGLLLNLLGGQDRQCLLPYENEDQNKGKDGQKGAPP